MPRRRSFIIILLFVLHSGCLIRINGFAPNQNQVFSRGTLNPSWRNAGPCRSQRLSPPSPFERGSATALNFMGSDGGLLGIGAPEVFTILLVGYFVLGPSDLYKLVKEIGKFIQNIRTFSSDLTTTFENNMESQLQLEDIRKAQRELTDAFNFRRTINVNPEEEAFATNVQSPREGSLGVEVSPAVAAAAAGEGTASATAAPKKLKIRRRVKKKLQPVEETESSSSSIVSTEIPDLEMPPSLKEETGWSSYTSEEEEAAAIEEEFNKYVSPTAEGGEWFDEPSAAGPTLGPTPAAIAEPTRAESSRFQQQLSSTWNQQILQNEEKLSPLATIMQKLALLEEEKATARQRLEEEFERKQQLEQEYYAKQRQILEEAASQIQTDLYVGVGDKNMTNK